MNTPTRTKVGVALVFSLQGQLFSPPYAYGKACEGRRHLEQTINREWTGVLVCHCFDLFEAKWPGGISDKDRAGHNIYRCNG